MLTIRRSLIRSFVLMIVVLSGVLLVIMTLQSYREIEQLSRSLVNRTSDQVNVELQGFFSPVQTEIHNLADWGKAGLLPLVPADLTRLMLPMLVNEAQISSMTVSGKDGHSYTLLEGEDEFHGRESRPETWQKTVHWTSYNRDGEPLRQWHEDAGFDARNRPWFTAASNANYGVPAWTDPYIFFTTKAPGITTAVRYQAPQAGNDDWSIASFDILLSDISTFTTGLKVSDHGMAMVVTDDGRVVGLPRDPRFQDKTTRRRMVLQPVDNLGIPVAATAWQKANRHVGIFSMKFNRATWWVSLQHFSLDSDHGFWIQVLVPETDFLENVKYQRNVILLAAFTALVIAVMIALRMAQAYSKPLEALVKHADRIRTLDLEPEPRSRYRLTEIERLDSALERMRSGLESFSRYVPVPVVKELIRRGDVARIGGHTAELSILFTDIESFTVSAEKMPPQAVAEHMGEYFDAMLGILQDHGATIDKLIGDAIMAFWGAPAEIQDHPRLALEAVLRCVARLAELQTTWRERGLPLLDTRFGLNYGQVMVGNVGAPSRLNFTILGDAVNLTARLEGANKNYGTKVLATRRFVEAVGDNYIFRWVDRVLVKGRSEPVDIFEPLGRAGVVDEQKLHFRTDYETAFQLIRNRQFQQALDILNKLGNNTSVQLFQKRCMAWLTKPPPSNWQGESRI